MERAREWCPVPTSTLTTQFVHLRLGDHYRRGNGKTVRAREIVSLHLFQEKTEQTKQEQESSSSRICPEPFRY